MECQIGPSCRFSSFRKSYSDIRYSILWYQKIGISNIRKSEFLISEIFLISVILMKKNIFWYQKSALKSYLAFHKPGYQQQCYWLSLTWIFQVSASQNQIKNWYNYRIDSRMFTSRSYDIVINSPCVINVTYISCGFQYPMYNFKRNS